MTDTRAIADIIVGERHRQDMGDIAALASSIEAVGLLHPPVVDKNNVLVAGERRIRAALLLGWSHIQVNEIDIAEIVLGEYAENEVRKDFSLSEAVAIKRLIEPAIVAEAAARKAVGENQHTKPAAKLAGTAKGDARDKVAKRTGKSHTTLAKAEKVIEAAEAEPEKFAPLVEEMDRTGKVDGPYKQLNASKATPTDAVKAKADRSVSKISNAAPDVMSAADRAGAKSDSAAKSKPDAEPAPIGTELIDVIDQIERVDVGATVVRMTNDDRLVLMTHIARANVFLDRIAIEVAKAGGASLGKLAPVALRVDALKFLKAATARIETELAGRTAAPADSKSAEP